jgi:hypothetical protein
MDINVVNLSNNFLTNVDQLVFNKTPDANIENVAQVSEPLEFDDSIDLSATAKAIVEWVNSYKTTLNSHISAIHYMNADSVVGLVIDKELLEANQNLLNYLESASIAEKSSKQYQDYVNKLRRYIAKIKNTLEDAELSLNDKQVEATNNQAETTQNTQDKTNITLAENSLGSFLTRSMDEFRDRLKEFLLPKNQILHEEAHDS